MIGGPYSIYYFFRCISKSLVFSILLRALFIIVTVKSSLRHKVEHTESGYHPTSNTHQPDVCAVIKITVSAATLTCLMFKMLHSGATCSKLSFFNLKQFLLFQVKKINRHTMTTREKRTVAAV